MSYRSIYDPPENYGVPNPLGPRTHNWKGGMLNEGSLYHGPVYTRPSYNLPWIPRPLNGAVGDDPEVGTNPPSDQQEGSMFSTILPVVAIGGLIIYLMWPGRV